MVDELIFYMAGSPAAGQEIFLRTDEILLELEIVKCLTPKGRWFYAEVMHPVSVGSGWYVARTLEEIGLDAGYGL